MTNLIYGIDYSFDGIYRAYHTGNILRLQQSMTYGRY